MDIWQYRSFSRKRFFDRSTWVYNSRFDRYSEWSKMDCTHNRNIVNFVYHRPWNIYLLPIRKYEIILIVMQNDKKEQAAQPEVNAYRWTSHGMAESLNCFPLILAPFPFVDSDWMDWKIPTFSLSAKAPTIQISACLLFDTSTISTSFCTISWFYVQIEWYRPSLWSLAHTLCSQVTARNVWYVRCSATVDIH